MVRRMPRKKPKAPEDESKPEGWSAWDTVLRSRPDQPTSFRVTDALEGKLREAAEALLEHAEWEEDRGATWLVRRFRFPGPGEAILYLTAVFQLVGSGSLPIVAGAVVGPDGDLELRLREEDRALPRVGLAVFARRFYQAAEGREGEATPERDRPPLLDVVESRPDPQLRAAAIAARAPGWVHQPSAAGHLLVRSFGSTAVLSRLVPFASAVAGTVRFLWPDLEVTMDVEPGWVSVLLCKKDGAGVTARVAEIARLIDDVADGCGLVPLDEISKDKAN
jgi:hypothetical protein